MRPFRALSELMLALIATIACCEACTLVYQGGQQVGSSFRVKVENQGRPVHGLRVEVGGAVAETDKNGLALFVNVRPGSYHVRANHDAGFPDGGNIDVKPGGPANATVRLKWPSMAPIAVRALEGVLRGQSRLSLDLLEGVSGRLLKSVETTDDGEFAFGGVEPGLYFLRVEPSGLIAVAVDQRAPTDRLDIDVGQNSCGFWYADRNRCPQPDLQMGQLTGQVVDAARASISNATILLFDRTHMQVARVQTDDAGKFTSPYSLAGTYELVVSAPGFTPLRRTVHAAPMGRSSLTVQLGFAGGCSSAKP